MENKEIAKRISEMVWKNYEDNDIFAVQLFVEKICLPEGVQSYTQEDLEEYILKIANNNFITEI
jgi:hypothetical protein